MLKHYRKLGAQEIRPYARAHFGSWCSVFCVRRPQPSWPV